MSNFRGELGLLLVAIIWGSGFIANDIALEHFNPFEVMAIRFSISAICLLIIFFRNIKNIVKTEFIHGIILGLFLYSSFAMQTIGLIYTTPSKNAFLTSVNVIIVPFIGVTIFKRKINFYGVLGATLSAVGIGLISLNSELKINLGDVLTLICALGFAFHIFFTGEFLNRGSKPIPLTIIQISTAAVISLVVVIFYSNKSPIPFSSRSFISALYLGFASTTLAFLLQTVSQKYTTETRAAIILSTESIFGTLFSVLILREALTLRTVLGCGVIFIAIMLSELNTKHSNSK